MPKPLDPTSPRDTFLCGISAEPLSQPLADEDYVATLLAEQGRERDSLSAALEALRQEARRMLLSDNLSDQTKRGIAAGLVAAHGEARFEDGTPRLTIRALPASAQGILADVIGAGPEVHAGGFGWSGVAALDALGAVVEGEGVPALPSMRRSFDEWCCRVSHVALARAERAQIRVQRVHEGAVVPGKERVSDSGYDLTLLYAKQAMGDVTLYGTGIVVEPPHGWYLDVVPRSSIIKRGYLLANNVGIIDRAYRGEIFVPLLKVDPDAPDLELPARVAQLIPRPIVHFPVTERTELTATDRGAGGFGSTGR